MGRLLKILKVLVYSMGGLFAVLNIGLGIAIIAWYGMIFYPYQDQIDKHIQQNQVELGNDTKQLQVLTKLNYYPSDLYKIASMKSYDYFYKGHHRSRLEGSLARSIWSIGIKLNYTEEQIFHLSTALTHYKWDKFGVNDAAIGQYGVPVNRLTLEQKAELVAYLRTPRFYERKPLELKERVKQLLEKYHQHTTSLIAGTP